MRDSMEHPVLVTNPNTLTASITVETEVKPATHRISGLSKATSPTK